MNRSRLFLAAALVSVAFPCASTAADPPAVAPAAAPGAPTIDPAAVALLQKAENAIFALQTYQADCWTTIIFDAKPEGTKPSYKYEMATLVAAKPNKMRYDQWPAQGVLGSPDAADWKRTKPTPDYTFVCDGKTNWLQFGPQYRTDTRTKPEMLNTILEPWDGFYAKSNSPYGTMQYYQKHAGSLLEVQAKGREDVNGVPCDKVFTHVKTSYGETAMEYQTTWYFGANDGLVRRKTEHVGFNDPTRSDYTRDATLRTIRTNAPIPTPAKTFAYVPPEGVQTEEERAQNAPKLLANGTAAPDFSATDKNGTTVKLSDFRGKVVVVDFWASWCPPCVASMPHNQEVTQKLQKQGVPFVLLALDNSEDRPAFLAWVSKHEAAMNALQFVYADPKTASIANTQYHVSGIPTQYVIDGSGIIRASFVGFDGPTDTLEKAIRAASTADATPKTPHRSPKPVAPPKD